MHIYKCNLCTSISCTYIFFCNFINYTFTVTPFNSMFVLYTKRPTTHHPLIHTPDLYLCHILVLVYLPVYTGTYYLCTFSKNIIQTNCGDYVIVYIN